MHVDTSINQSDKPQTSATPNRGLRRISYGLLGVLIALVLLGVAGAVYQSIASARATVNYPPPGRMVVVNGREMHIYCAGEGSPTVILEAGGGGNALSWYMVQPQVAGTTRVCAYDRAGMGWSDAGPEPRNGQEIATELHTLLQNAGIPGPYVLAGWSYGGLFVRAFAQEYPEEIAGLVLLDATHPEVWTRTEQGQARYQSDSNIYSASRVLARLGLLRLWNPLAAPPDTLPAELAGSWNAVMSTTSLWDTTEAESQNILDTMARLRQAAPLGDIPLLVVTAGNNQGVDGQWPTFQNELAQLSTNSVHRIVEGADHPSLLWEPTAAAASSAAILQVVNAVRSGEPLTP